ncbi:MAG: hypothetical protein ABEI52_10255 [Halobacteriaceae archaeon]
MRAGRDDNTVTCIACGAERARDDAREYDKEGDRWDRDGKHFEYLCKSCFRELDKTDRDGLEEMLIGADAGSVKREEFLERYLSRIDSETDEQRHE